MYQSAKYLLFYSFFLFINSITLSQTWETTFANAEKLFEKGKYKKVIEYTQLLEKQNTKHKESINSWIPIMNAKAFESSKKYPSMFKSIDLAKKRLELIKNTNPTNYSVGIIKLIDLYNEYGNHRKAHELTTLLSKNYNDTSLISNEIFLRKAITQFENGNYSSSDSLLSLLEKNWNNILKSSYHGEQLNQLDFAYRKDLLGLIKVTRLEILVEKGLYKRAKEQYNNTNETLKALLNPKRSSFFKHLMIPVDVSFGEKNYKATDKHLDNYFSKLETGNSVEQGILKEIKLSFLIKDNPGVYNARSYVFNYSSKVNAPKEYRDFLISYIEYVDEFMDKELHQMHNKIKACENTPNTYVPEDHPLKTLFYSTLLSYYKELEHPETFDFLKRSIPLFENTTSKRYTGGIHLDLFKVSLANYYLNYSNSPLKSHEILSSNTLKNIFSQIAPTHGSYSEIVNELNDYLLLTSEFDLCITLNRNAVKAKRKSNYDLGKQQIALATILSKSGNYTEAEKIADEALILFKQDGIQYTAEYMESLNLSAILYAQIGNYIKAKDLLRKSKQVGRGLRSVGKNILLNTIEDLAIINSKLGNYSETERYLTEAISKKAKIYGPNSCTLIKYYNALGQIYLLKGEFSEAEKFIQNSIQLTETYYGKSTIIYADMLNSQVHFYMELGNYKAALKNALEVFNIRKEKLRKDHITLANSNTDFAMIHFNMADDLNAVEEYLQEAKRIVLVNFNMDHPLYAQSLKNIAYINIEKNQLDEALIFLNQADEIWEKTLGENNTNSGEVLRLKGDIYTAKGQYEKAKTQYEKAALYFEKTFNKEHPEYLKTQSKLAQSYFISGKIDNVKEILATTISSYMNYTEEHFPTLNEDEKAKFWSKIKPDIEFYNTIAISSTDNKEKHIKNMYNLSLLSKGMLLNSSIKTRKAILNSGDSTLIHTFENWIANKELLTASLAQKEESLKENGIDLQYLRTDISRLEKELNKKSAAFGKEYKTKHYKWQDIQQLLKPNEAAIEIVRFREFDTKFNNNKIRYAALILTQETKTHPELVLLENGNEMEEKGFPILRKTIKMEIRNEIPTNYLWSKIGERIKNKTIVYFSADGIYNQINIEALPTSDGGYVIDKTNIRVLSSTRALAENRLSKKEVTNGSNQMSALLFGNPLYYSKSMTSNMEKLEIASRAVGLNVIQQLPGAELEVNLIDEILLENNWKVKRVIGKEATEKILKETKNVNVVHIATHGFFDEKPAAIKKQFGLFEEDNPMDRSGILTNGGGDVLLSETKNYNVFDGVLTANEAMNLNFDKTELVVLSACETGRGEIKQGEGVFGLQRSFLVAGADALIMSLFKVSDEVTQKLMVEFYKNWNAGYTKREAFNKAQKTIKKDFPEPIYWGAFMMIAKD